jgi:hypothetical protein
MSFCFQAPFRGSPQATRSAGGHDLTFADYLFIQFISAILLHFFYKKGPI